MILIVFAVGNHQSALNHTFCFFVRVLKWSGSLLSVGWVHSHWCSLVHGACEAWMKAAGISDEQESTVNPVIYMITLLMWIVSSFFLQRYLMLGATSLIEAIGLPFMGLLGLLSTTLSTLYGMRGRNLLWIDAGYTLADFIVIAIVYTLLYLRPSKRLPVPNRRGGLWGIAPSALTAQRGKHSAARPVAKIALGSLKLLNSRALPLGS